MGRTFVRLDEIVNKFGYTNLTPEIDLHKIRVYHRSINRPAFQLIGFYEYFDNKRIQVIGEAENVYIKQLDKEVALERFEKMFSIGFPGMIIARDIRLMDELIPLAKKYNIPLLSTDKTTALVIIEIIRWMNEQLAETITLHGVLVDVFGEGIVITGESGVGKSETAIELIKRGHRLVADDVIEISKISEDILIGKAPEISRHFAELRGIGIVDVKSLYGVESVKEFTGIGMIINLEEWDGDSDYDRLGLNEEYEEILGVKIEKYRVPIRPGRNLSIIVETAAVNNRQKKMGYNAAKEIVERVSKKVHGEDEYNDEEQ